MDFYHVSPLLILVQVVYDFVLFSTSAYVHFAILAVWFDIWIKKRVPLLVSINDSRVSVILVSTGGMLELGGK